MKDPEPTPEDRERVLYLTNYWSIKGYDMAVFPREGEPVLIVVEPQLETAERNEWTTDIRTFKGYDEQDPRPPPARALELAVDACRDFDRIALELSLGAH